MNTVIRRLVDQDPVDEGARRGTAPANVGSMCCLMTGDHKGGIHVYTVSCEVG